MSDKPHTEHADSREQRDADDRRRDVTEANIALDEAFREGDGKEAFRGDRPGGLRGNPG